MEKIIGFMGLVLLASLMACIVYRQIVKHLKRSREKKDIFQRNQKLNSDFESLEREQKDVLILFFEHGPSSEWGKKNREEIECLNVSLKHLSQSILDNKDSDLFQISLLEKDVVRIRNKIEKLKTTGAL